MAAADSYRQYSPTTKFAVRAELRQIRLLFGLGVAFGRCGRRLVRIGTLWLVNQQVVSQRLATSAKGNDGHAVPAERGGNEIPSGLHR